MKGSLSRKGLSSLPFKLSTCTGRQCIRECTDPESGSLTRVMHDYDAIHPQAWANNNTRYRQRNGNLPGAGMCHKSHGLLRHKIEVNPREVAFLHKACSVRQNNQLEPYTLTR